MHILQIKIYNILSYDDYYFILAKIVNWAFIPGAFILGGFHPKPQGIDPTEH